MGIQEWSATDIENARSYFLEGLAIKRIAKELGRTTTATNKALSRFGIRFEKPRKNFSESHSTYKKEKNLTPAAIVPSFERYALQKEFENWVGFWQVCQYLSSQNICLYELSAPNIDLKCRQFKVGTKTLNAGQLLVMANKRRIEENLKTFFVKGLSW